MIKRNILNNIKLKYTNSALFVMVVKLETGRNYTFCRDFPMTPNTMIVLLKIGRKK